MSELGLAVAAGALNTGSTIAAGNFQQRSAVFQARQAHQLANEAAGVGQRRAEAERRQTQLMVSRAQAVAAASGAGATDPTVINVISRIEEEGELRALTSLAEGRSRERNLRLQADSLRFQGRAARRASRLRAAGTILETAGTVSRYG